MIGRRRVAVRDARLCGPPQHGFDTRFELIDVERLGDEVVSAELQTEDGIALLRRGAADDDRHVGDRFEARTQHEPVDVGQHQIENDQIGPGLLEQVFASAPVSAATPDNR